MIKTELYLASRSPRRKELLQQIGVVFEVMDVEIDESQQEGENPFDYVSRLALSKAKKAWLSLNAESKAVVLGADTCVVIDDRILGKPRDKSDAIDMLQSLSGRSHEVYTGVAVVKNVPDNYSVQVNVTKVKFKPLIHSECVSYWNTGEPTDKAGGYAIQGYAAAFIEYIEGSYSGVMGLPLYETAIMLTDMNILIGQR